MKREPSSVPFSNVANFFLGGVGVGGREESKIYNCVDWMEVDQIARRSIHILPSMV